MAKRVAVKKVGKKKVLQDRYTYNTKMSVIAKNCGLDLGDVSPSMKLGDFFKMIGHPAMARILKMMS